MASAQTPRGVNHLVLNVRDLDESHKFWTEIVGFRCVAELKPKPGRTMKMRFYSGVRENGDASFGYTTTGGLSPSTFNLSNGGVQTYSSATQVQAGNYSVTESTLPTGWTLKNLACTATGTGTSYSLSGATTNITMAPEGVVDCTYTNHINRQPAITTTLSADTVVVGGTVHDSSTLTGATANAGGTVTYTVYSDSTCSTSFANAGTKTVTNGVVPDSDAVTFNSGAPVIDVSGVAINPGQIVGVS